MPRPERIPHLDDYKRREFVAILAVGGSRQSAARYVGCSVAGILRLAEKDAGFAEAMRRAEKQPEIASLRRLQDASKQDKNWRAAAWVLERKNPDDFSARGPQVITMPELGAMLAKLAEWITRDLPAAFRSRVVKRVAALERLLRKEQEARRREPPVGGDPEGPADKGPPEEVGDEEPSESPGNQESESDRT